MPIQNVAHVFVPARQEPGKKIINSFAPVPDDQSAILKNLLKPPRKAVGCLLVRLELLFLEDEPVFWLVGWLVGWRRMRGVWEKKCMTKGEGGGNGIGVINFLFYSLRSLGYCYSSM